MTVVERFKKDRLVNEQSPRFAPYDDCVLGERFTGGFKRIGHDKDGDYIRYFFDNGQNYTFVTNEEMLYECNPIPDDYFIHKYIEKCIYDIITINSDKELPAIVCQENEVLSKENPIIIIRIIIDRECRIVYVTNIFVPMEKRYNGYGKKLLGEVYAICLKLGYRLLLTEMVESFYYRMVQRGAMVIDALNVVEITKDTNLSPY